MIYQLVLSNSPRCTERNNSKIQLNGNAVKFLFLLSLKEFPLREGGGVMESANWGEVFEEASGEAFGESMEVREKGTGIETDGPSVDLGDSLPSRSFPRQ